MFVHTYVQESERQCQTPAAAVNSQRWDSWGRRSARSDKHVTVSQRLNMEIKRILWGDESFPVFPFFGSCDTSFPSLRSEWECLLNSVGGCLCFHENVFTLRPSHPSTFKVAALETLSPLLTHPDLRSSLTWPPDSRRLLPRSSSDDTDSSLKETSNI